MRARNASDPEAKSTRQPRLLTACILLAALTIGCNDPYKPVSNPDAAEEQKLKKSREKAEAVRRKAEEQNEAIRRAYQEMQVDASGNRERNPEANK